jgi:hypothetical protein
VITRQSSRAQRAAHPVKSGGAAVHCALCEREVRRANRHHIVPKSEGGTHTVWLCLTCHKTLHHFFTNATLATEKYSIDMLRADPDIARYLAWVRDKPDQHYKVRRRRARR